MDTIPQLTAIAPVSSSSSQGRGRGKDQQAPPQGQFLKALVLEAKGNHRFILDIGGTRQAVSSEAPLSPGQALRLQVIKTEPHIELQIISNPLSQFQGRSLMLLGKNIDLAGLFRAFQHHTPPPLEAVSQSSRSLLEGFYSLQKSGIEGEDGGVVLKRLIDSLGLNLEQLLAKGDIRGAGSTLKAALLDIAHNFDTASNIAETTNKILTTLELFQLAQLQVASDTRFILPLPLPFIDQGYLIVERGDTDTGEGGPPPQEENRFSLHLTVSELGNLQIDFLQNLEGLFIRFRASDQEKAAFIEQNSTDLKKAITDVPLIGISFTGDAPDPIQDLLRQIVSDGSSMLDTKV